MNGCDYGCGRIGSLVSPCLQFAQVPCSVLRAAGQDLVLSWGLWSPGAFGPGLGVGIPDFVGPLVLSDLHQGCLHRGKRVGVGVCTSSPGVGGFCCMSCSLLFHHGDGIVLVHVLVLLIDTPGYSLNKTGQVGCTRSDIRIPQRFSVLQPDVTLN